MTKKLPTLVILKVARMILESILTCQKMKLSNSHIGFEIPSTKEANFEHIMNWFLCNIHSNWNKQTLILNIGNSFLWKFSLQYNYWQYWKIILHQHGILRYRNFFFSYHYEHWTRAASNLQQQQQQQQLLSGVSDVLYFPIDVVLALL